METRYILSYQSAADSEALARMEFPSLQSATACGIELVKKKIAMGGCVRVELQELNDAWESSHVYFIDETGVCNDF